MYEFCLSLFFFLVSFDLCFLLYLSRYFHFHKLSSSEIFDNFNVLMFCFPIFDIFQVYFLIANHHISFTFNCQKSLIKTLNHLNQFFHIIICCLFIVKLQSQVQTSVWDQELTLFFPCHNKNNNNNHTKIYQRETSQSS